MKFEQLFIGFIVFGLVLFVGYGLYYQSYLSYEMDTDLSIFGDLNTTLNESVDVTRELEADSQNLEVGEEGTEGRLYLADVGLVKKASLIKTNVGNAFAAIQRSTGGIIPVWIWNTLLAMIGALLLAFLIYMIMRFKPQD